MDEIRYANAIVNQAGGNASKNAVRYKVMLPSSWVKAMGISKNEPKMEISFDGKSVTIKKAKKNRPEDFIRIAKEAGHAVKVYKYYHDNELCSTIFADFAAKQIVVNNSVDNIVQTAFGRNENPSWDDFMSFLCDRCIPQTRRGIDDILQSMGLDSFNPIEIIQKTQGHMAEDKQWLSISEV